MMISFDTALQRILDCVPSPLPEQQPLHDARGRVLAEDIHARRDQPPWDNTAVDGFAVYAADTVTATTDTPVTLQVLETVAAGAMPSQTVIPGHCTRIMTGAPMPAGADAVVMVEDSRGSGDHIEILAVAEVADNIRPRGEDVMAGDAVLTHGAVLSAAHLGMAAAMGRSQLTVFRAPRVGILSTGDEIAEIDEPVGEERILNVNSHALAAQVASTGAVPVKLGIAKDTPEAIRSGIIAGLSTDILIISGGVSMGDFDFVKPIMDELGGGLDFWKVKIKPARPLAFGVIRNIPTFGLPGNPVSSMVSFELFVRPFLKACMGHTMLDPVRVTAHLTEPVRKKAGRKFFLRAVVEPGPDGLTCRTTGPQGSGMLTSMVQANGLMELEEALDGTLPVGTPVPVRLLPDP